MIWAETIIWKDYPEHKPENDGYYWFLFRKKTGGTYTVQTKWKDGYLKYLDDDRDVVAFAELPTGAIGNEFNFETAVMLMLDGKECVVVDGDSKDTIFRYNKQLERFEEKFGECLWSETFYSDDEIFHKWRKR